MYPERLFTLVGSRFEPTLVLEIGKAHMEEHGDILKKQFRHYTKMLQKMQFQEALLDLMELEHKVQPLGRDDRFAALVTLTATACRRYVLAHYYENRACELEARWEPFAEMSEDVYESGEFFLADQLQVKIENLDLNATVPAILLAVEPTLQQQLGKICQFENTTLWECFYAEKYRIRHESQMTNEELIMQLCDEILLPFYARLELLRIAEEKKIE